MTRLATIDLGTNTVHLLVAEVTPRARGWRTVLATQRVTRLGEGVSATGALGDLPAARTAAVVVDYVARARAAGAARVAIVATSAVRDAANGRAFAADLERATGVAVRGISGGGEARLTLAGTLAALDLGLADYDPARVQGHTLTREAIARQHRRLAALDLAGRARVPCLEPGRADLIVPGVAIVEATLARLHCERLVVSDFSLREGILAELAAREV